MLTSSLLNEWRTFVEAWMPMIGNCIHSTWTWLIENNICLIWKLGWPRAIFTRSGGDDWEPYPFNLEFGATENYICSILGDDWELYLPNLEFGVTENYICSIWTLEWLRTVFAQSRNLKVDWELYSLNLEIWKSTKNCIQPI